MEKRFLGNTKLSVTALGYGAMELSKLSEKDESRSSFLIRFAMNHPAICTFIIGTKSYYHLIENIKAVKKGKLPEEIYREAKRRLDSIDVVADESLKL